jgi:hypothetical protein
MNRLIQFSKLFAKGALFGRIVIALIVVGNVLGFAANTIGAVFLSNSFAEYDAAASRNSSEHFERAFRGRRTAQYALSVHLFFETIMLLFIVSGLIVGIIFSMRRFRAELVAAKLRLLNRSSSPRHHDEKVHPLGTSSDCTPQLKPIRSLRFQVLVCCAVLFSCFVLRACYITMFAVSGSLNDNARECPSFINRCSDCFNTYTHITVWLLYSPGFFMTVTIISHALALLVALWGMTSSRMMHSLKKHLKQLKPRQISHQIADA